MERVRKRPRLCPHAQLDTTDPWGMLPVELCLDIWRYFRPVPELLNMMTVCKRWHELLSATSPLWAGDVLFTAISLETLPVQTVRAWLARCPPGKLRSFAVLLCNFGSGELQEIMPHLLAHASGLENLYWSGIFNELPLSMVISFARLCHNLRHVQMSLATCSDVPGCGNGFDFLAHLPDDIRVSLTLEDLPQETRWLTINAGASDAPSESPLSSTDVRFAAVRLIALPIISPEVHRVLCDRFPNLEGLELHENQNFPIAREILRLWNPHSTLTHFKFCIRYDSGVSCSMLTGFRSLHLCNFQWHLALLPGLHSLVIDQGTADYWWDENMHKVFRTVQQLRKLDVPLPALPRNFSRYVMLKCSPHLEHIVFRELPPPDHLACLMDGSFIDSAEDEQPRFPYQRWMKKLEDAADTDNAQPYLSKLRCIEVRCRDCTPFDWRTDIEGFDEDQWEPWIKAVKEVVAQRPQWSVSVQEPVEAIFHRRLLDINE